MVRRLARLLLVLALAAAVPAAAAEDPTGAAIATLNAARADRGLGPVVERRELSAAASDHAADLARHRSFDLEASGTVPLRERMARAGYVPPASRTLLTAGYPDIGLLFESLLGEDASVAALLDPDVGEIGIGHTPGPYRVADGRIVTHTWLLILAQTRFQPVADPGGRLLAAINRARGQRGIGAVSPVAGLTAAAQDHARDMVARGYFDHQSPEGRSIADRAQGRHYDFRKIGENLAVGQATPDQVVQAWTDSPGHARVLYDPTLREVGIGYLPGPLRKPPQTFNHVWVAVFGTRR